MALVGRADELQRLERLVQALPDGGSAILLRGPAGIGKTALLEELTTRARASGLLVLRTVGVEAESHLPFAGLHQLLRPVRSDVVLLPEPYRVRLDAAFGLGTGVVPDAFLVAMATLDLLTEVAARQPVLVVAEDAHWLDRSTADVLSFLARRLESDPILLAMAVREGEAAQLDTSGIPELVVCPLSPAHSATLLDAHGAGLSEGVRRQVLTASAGNPLALIELAAGAGSVAARGSADSGSLPLPERLVRVFTARVGQLPERTRTALLVAALSDGDSIVEITAAAGLLAGTAVGPPDLAPAVAARLVDLEGGERFRFRHPLMRSAMHQLASPERLREVHAALAEVLAQDPERSIWHRALATEGPDEELASRLDGAAQDMLRRGAVSGAVSALEHAARLSRAPDDRADRLLRAADLAVELGRQEVVERLLGVATRLDLSEDRRARLAWTREGFEDGLRSGATDASTLARLAESVAADGELDLAVRILWSAALRCFWTEPGPAARARIVEVAEGLPLDELDARLLAILAYAAPIDRGATVIERSQRLARRSALLDAQTERLLGSGAVLLGTFALAQSRSAGSVAGLRAEGRLQLLARALAAQAWSATHLVDLNAAIPAAEEARGLAEETGQPYLHALVLATQAKIAALRGELDDAERLAATAVRAATPVVARPVLATAQDARALAALVAGEYAEAFARFARMHDPSDPSYQLALRCHTLAGLADAAVRAGEQEEGCAIVDGLEKAGTRTTSPSLHAGLRLARALLADEERAERLFTEALRADLTDQPFVRAQTWLAYGEWLRRHRRVAESREPLRTARDTFDALGAAPWSERARRELRAAGERSAARPSSAIDRLTPQELQIAQLASTGLTNREIGQRLYVSHRTVGAHLAQVFPKLGIRSRTQLHDALGG